jgi:hypothetical protein
MQQLMPNPSLEGLDVFVGEWNVEISNISFLSDPSARGLGQYRFEWLEGGAFLMMHSEVEDPHVPDAVAVIGRDNSVETYSMLYYDTRGVSRIYEMSLEEGVWKLWRNSPDFSQRFTGRFSEDGDTITASWEKSSDRSNWEHDFDMTYKRRAR